MTAKIQNFAVRMEIKEGHIILTKQEHEQLLQTIAALEATIKVQRETINKQQEIINKHQETINKQQEIINKHQETSINNKNHQ